jgi:hypothetical protein
MLIVHISLNAPDGLDFDYREPPAIWPLRWAAK